MKTKEYFFVVAAILLFGFISYSLITLPYDIKDIRKTDDWKFKPSKEGFFSKVGGILPSLGGTKMYSMSSNAMPTGSAEDSLGFSVGGAKDINNFRRNIENNYLPLYTDITYEGLFYDYYFDTGKNEICNELFCPSYTYAISKDPFSGKEDYYLSVGLNSNLKEEDFQRKKLNLIVVMDISGSMGSSFNRYYYDQFRKKDIQNEDSNSEDNSKTKIEVANEAVVALLGHLNDEDSFGMVLFDNTAYLGKPISLVSDTDMDAIKGHILEISPQGGTRFSEGYKMASEMLNEYSSLNQEEYENRIIFLTDAMPNLGETSEEGLLGMTKENSENSIYTTFIGIGVDFNTELIEYITKIRGANYYSVNSNKEFKERMDEGFDYMITPLVFNLNLELEAQGYKIEKVYGSPEADEATGQIMKVNTLFPSRTEEGETKGGLVLLKLKKLSDDAELKLKVSYEDRNGEKYSDEKTVEMKDEKSDYYQNNGIRKGILLSRYADLVKNWIIDERSNYPEEPITSLVNYEKGIICPPDMPLLGKWERQSLALRISTDYKKLFDEFSEYYKSEIIEINDRTLEKEIEILDKLSK